LPNTGSGTLPVALAGFGALGIGALAVWYGTRKNAHGVPPRLH
jgi:LPXTG-motif cell wall-anchored protein